MIHLNKIYIAFITAIFTLAFSSCTEKVPSQDPSPVPEGGNQVFIFQNTPTSLIFTPVDEQAFTIKVGREQSVAQSAATIPLKVDDPDGAFTIPASVSFAAGAVESEIPIIFNLEVSQSATFTVSFASEDAYPYGQPSVTIKVLRDYDWADAGTAIWTSEWSGTTAEIPIQFAQGTNPKMYRVLSPYFYLEPDYADEGYDLTFYLDDNYNALKFDSKQPIGESAKNGNPILMYGFSGNTFTNVGNVFTISTTFAYDNNAGAYSGWGGITETFVWDGYPGVMVAQTDYSINLSYLGHYIDPDGKADNAIVQFTNGADVASYKYAVVNGVLTAATAEGVANKIIDGTLASEEGTGSGYKIFPLTDAGKYSVVAVSYNDAGESQEFGYVSFEFTPAGMESPWVSLGFCKYTDGVLIPMFSDDPVNDIETYDVEIFENHNTPGLFRLKNAYGAAHPWNAPGDYVEGDVFIEINATDPDGVYIDYQSMGVDWSYGNMDIYSKASYYMDGGKSFEEVKAAGYCGIYKDNVITFPKGGLLIFIEGLNKLYPTNEDGLWKVDMTSLRSSISKNAPLRSNGQRSFNSKKATSVSLSKNVVHPVRVKGKNVRASVIRSNESIMVR